MSKCPNPDPEMKLHWKKQLEDELTKKRESLDSATGDFPKKSRLPGIAKHFQTQDKEQSDKALVRWLASAGLSPNVTEIQEFKGFLKKAEKTGPAYKTPERHILTIHYGECDAYGASPTIHATIGEQGGALTVGAVHLWGLV